ncbi:hypothetical protein ACHAWO_003882 [Cyclotella atomus]|uniref:Uncharacterized protein n=1 Tax=Cyclotella atomus TaxID=382360 RepID=A0ABD3MNL1_9STRA
MADNDGWNTVSHKHKLTPRISEPEDDDGGDFVVYSPRKKKTRDATEANPLKNQCKFVLILVGIPGSGKSTFATKLENIAPHKYARVNQDIIGNRRDCEDLTRKILSQNKIPIIDRCNFSPDQRQTWVDIASSVGASVDCIVFSYNTEVCIRRCRERKFHETITAHNAVIVSRLCFIPR